MATDDQEARIIAVIKREYDAVHGPGITLEAPAPWIIAAVRSFAAEREAIVREECARIAERRAGYVKRGQTIAAAIRGNARERP